ncbi:ATP-binding protein [Rhizobium sp. Root1220]|uniref:sensor histidine kinase n=1 Tax=Rhizobium sp. Root1220 TaxID=1736432 RepID=UPI000700C5E3|nr:ATP-binding protein [Rhizobium sp. Root1220]KQV73275.1 hypothetical protein ASC90_07725 [Rhizobium sp. Root1220]
MNTAHHTQEERVSAVDPLVARMAEEAAGSVVVYGIDGIVLHCNSVALALFGWKVDEVLGRDVASAVDKGDLPWREIAKWGCWQGVVTRSSMDTVVTLNVRVFAISSQDGGVSHYVEFGRRRSASQFSDLEADVIHADRLSALGQLIAMIAHEVRQPLSVIVTDAATGARWLEREPLDRARVAALMTRIEENAHRANNVIRRVHEMTAKKKTAWRRVSVNTVADEAIRFVMPNLQSYGIEVCRHFEPTLPDVVGDRIQLQQVLVNLLLNSVHATSSPYHSVREIHIATTLEDGAIRMTVRDTGGGIDSENLDRIFDGFFSTKPEGAGLGLAICRSILSNHGGSIMATSGSDGATMTVILPAAQEVDANLRLDDR